MYHLLAGSIDILLQFGNLYPQTPPVLKARSTRDVAQPAPSPVTTTSVMIWCALIMGAFLAVFVRMACQSMKEIVLILWTALTDQVSHCTCMKLVLSHIDNGGICCNSSLSAPLYIDLYIMTIAGYYIAELCCKACFPATVIIMSCRTNRAIGGVESSSSPKGL